MRNSSENFIAYSVLTTSLCQVLSKLTKFPRRYTQKCLTTSLQYPHEAYIIGFLPTVRAMFMMHHENSSISLVPSGRLFDTQPAASNQRRQTANHQNQSNKQQVRKVLWTRKAPACLLTLLYAYGKPRLCKNIHHYAPPRTVLQQPGRTAAHRATAGRCDLSECSMSSLKSIT